MSLVAFAIGFLAGTTFGFFYLLSFTPVRTGSRGVRKLLASANR